MVTLYYTKLITGGLLKGSRFNESLSFPDVDSAAMWAKRVKKHKVKNGPHSWQLIDASFQKYWRD